MNCFFCEGYLYVIYSIVVIVFDFIFFILEEGSWRCLFLFSVLGLFVFFCMYDCYIVVFYYFIGVVDQNCSVKFSFVSGNILVFLVIFYQVVRIFLGIRRIV